LAGADEGLIAFQSHIVQRLSKKKTYITRYANCIANSIGRDKRQLNMTKTGEEDDSSALLLTTVNALQDQLLKTASAP